MAKHSLVFPAGLAGIELQRGRGIGRQLYQALRQRILDGKLSGGARLPASRELADLLAISRNTVMKAYEQLYAEGFVEGRVGDGTYVVALLPDTKKSSGSEYKLSTYSSTGLSTSLPTGLSTKTAALKPEENTEIIHSPALQRLDMHHLRPPVQGLPRAFRVGVPAFDLFPFDVWGRLHAAFWRKPGLHALGYGEPAGEWQLRELIARYLRTARGLDCNAEQIVITSGAQQAISLCAQLLLAPGDSVAVENPGYRAAGHALALTGARVLGMAVDAEGMRCDRLHDAGCKLAYVTPSHQYPTGVVMSLARRLELLAWAERAGGWIIEDDYDGEYRYSGAPLAPLAALDRQALVLYVGTFGKVVFPALRLGYLVLPSELIQAFERRKALDMRHSEVSTQRVMAQFMALGHFQRHIRRMRRAALSRRDALLAGWPRDLPGCEPMPSVIAGLHATVRVARLAREQELIAKAAAVDVEINPLSDYWLPDSTEPVDNRAGMVLGFAAVNEQAIAEALRKLRYAWSV